MDFMIVFGECMTKLLDKPLYHCVGLIKLSIKDSGRDPDADLNYQDYLEVFQVHLLARLQSLHVKDPEGIAAAMVDELNGKQSLFTMSIH